MAVFRPSRGYGWAATYPLSSLTVTSQRADNTPTTSHNSNLSLLSDFLAKIPYKLRVNSGYRSLAVNTLVGGATTSQHMNGLAVDLTPSGLTNAELATWLYKNKASFPELDQVIWYSDTSHVHVGICPTGGTGCSRRGEFLTSSKEGGYYRPWAPTTAELAKQAALFIANRPLATAGWLGVIGLVAVAGALLYRRRFGS